MDTQFDEGNIKKVIEDYYSEKNPECIFLTQLKEEVLAKGFTEDYWDSNSAKILTMAVDIK